MKNIKITALAILLLVAIIRPVNAQGWNQDRSGIYSIGMGGTQVVALGPAYSFISAAGLSLNVSGEYKVGRFVGLGFETGMDVFFGPYPTYYPYSSAYASIGIPVGMKVNVHVLEAANVPIADKLDVFAGLNLGGGPAFYTGPGGGFYGFLQAGPQIGIRYWLNHDIGVFGEFGWGATFGNIGLSF